MSDPFGFHVEKTTDDYDDPAVTLDPPRWEVYLPHSCDRWYIAGENYGVAVPHTDAVERLEAFIAEAQAALAALKDHREVTP